MRENFSEGYIKSNLSSKKLFTTFTTHVVYFYI